MSINKLKNIINFAYLFITISLKIPVYTRFRLSCLRQEKKGSEISPDFPPLFDGKFKLSHSLYGIINKIVR